MATCHKGFEWVEVETRGRAAHGSRPADGRDAILRMGRVLGRLEAVNARLAAGSSHPLLGPASLHASTIEGGRELSVYPDRCRLSFERRTLLGEPPDAGLAEAREILGALAGEDSEFEGSARPIFTRPPHELPVEHPLCRALARALRRRGEAAEPDRHVVLDRCGDPVGGGNPGGAVRAPRGGPAQP